MRWKAAWPWLLLVACGAVAGLAFGFALTHPELTQTQLLLRADEWFQPWEWASR